MLMSVYVSCLSFRNQYVWVGAKVECIFQWAGPDTAADIAFSIAQVQGKKRRHWCYWRGRERNGSEGVS